MPKDRTPLQIIEPHLFAHHALAQNSKYDLVVVASQDRWNDFGFSILASIGFRRDDGELLWMQGKLAVRGVPVLRNLQSQLLSEGRTSAPLHEAREPFASILLDVKSYAELRAAVGETRARQLLDAAHDISLLRDAGRTVPDWPDFFTSKVYALSMVRSSEAYLAERHAAIVLQGGDPFALGDVRMPFEARLTGAPPRLAFKFEFGRSALRGRIAVLVGKNGLGKTTSLAKIAQGLVDRNYRNAQLIPRPEVNQVLAFAHSSSLHKFVRRSDAGSARVRAFALDVGRTKKSQSLTALLAEISRGTDDNGRLLQSLHEILVAEFPQLQVAVPVLDDGSVEVPKRGSFDLLTRMKGSANEMTLLERYRRIDQSRELEFLDEKGSTRKLSLGQLAFLRFVLIAFSNAGPGSVLVVDEPENFLHPNLISRFMRVLNQVLKSVRSIGIIATHSPFIVREVQSAQVHILSGQAATMNVSHPRMQTLGANVASISDEVFGDDLHQHLFEELLAEEHIRDSSVDELLKKYAGEMSVEALMLVRSKIEGAK
jgi:predicted ATPase